MHENYNKFVKIQQLKVNISVHRHKYLQASEGYPMRAAKTENKQIVMRN